MNPTKEGAGAVTSDSLAAESVRSGGAFGSNRDSEPLSVKGGNSTLNTTDTSSATTLPPAPDARTRDQVWNESGGGDKYPEGAGGQGNFPGSHAGGSYSGGPTSAKREMMGGAGSGGGEGYDTSGSGGAFSEGGAGGGGGGRGGRGDAGQISSSGTGLGSSSGGASTNSTTTRGDTTHDTSYGGGDDNKPGVSRGNTTDTDAAPGYVADVTQPFNQSKPKGKNLTETEDLEGPVTHDAEIGSEQDPGRKAESDFQRKTQSASGSTAPRQGVQSGEAGLYDVLEDDQNL